MELLIKKQCVMNRDHPIYVMQSMLNLHQSIVFQVPSPNYRLQSIFNIRLII